MVSITGEELRRIRHGQKLSQRQMAALFGYTRPHLTKIENGHHPIPERILVLLEEWGWLEK